MTAAPNVLAAGPLTLEEAESVVRAVRSSLPPPPELPDDLAGDLPDDIELCSCDESVALRAVLACERSLRQGFQALADLYAGEILDLREREARLNRLVVTTEARRAKAEAELEAARDSAREVAHA